RFDPLGPLRVGEKEGVMTQVIDLARQTSTESRHPVQPTARKNFAASSLVAQKKVHIIVNLRGPQRAQQRASANALIETTQLGLVKSLRQFRLANQNDLERAAVRRPGVGQQAQFLQRFITEPLGLVEDQYHSMAVHGIGHECPERMK